MRVEELIVKRLAEKGFEDYKVMTEITDTFYQGLYRLWNRIEVKRRSNLTS